jgi:SAM-dependent methyltransferase
MSNSGIDAANAEFWNELCGSHLATSLGIRDRSLESLRRFDEAYLDYYPYLVRYAKWPQLKGQKVLEVGLGYGTLGQKIAEAGASYTGLDLAEGPVKMMKHRLRMQNLSGNVIRGNILSAPIHSGALDCVISIGCFHHTGDVRGCIEQTFRVLKPGGTAILMLYNKFSYRQWLRWPKPTFIGLANELGFSGGRVSANPQQRAAYDSNIAGSAAPETTFLSIRELQKMFANYSRVRFHKENCDELMLRGRVLSERKTLLTSLGKLWGLDIYIEAQK